MKIPRPRIDEFFSVGRLVEFRSSRENKKIHSIVCDIVFFFFFHTVQSATNETVPALIFYTILPDNNYFPPPCGVKVTINNNYFNIKIELFDWPPPRFCNCIVIVRVIFNIFRSFLYSSIVACRWSRVPFDFSVPKGKKKILKKHNPVDSTRRFYYYYYCLVVCRI